MQDKAQAVKINDTVSMPGNVNSGVPHGSILGVTYIYIKIYIF